MRVSDRQRGPGRKKNRVWIVLLIVIVIILGIMIAVNQSGSKQEPSTAQSGENKSVAEITKKPETEEEKENQESSEEADDGLEFPYLLDDDQLQVDSLFQYSGVNPDAQNEENEDIASIQLKNNSEQYLESAEISVELTDGTAFSFKVQDIPAGKSVMAFDTSNAAYDGKTGVAFIDADTSYSSEAGLQEETVKITSDEGEIQLENISRELLGNIKVKYHCVLDALYFGGCSIESDIAGLEAGENTVLDTSESILGDAEVVSITY